MASARSNAVPPALDAILSTWLLGIKKSAAKALAMDSSFTSSLRTHMPLVRFARCATSWNKVKIFPLLESAPFNRIIGRTS